MRVEGDCRLQVGRRQMYYLNECLKKRTPIDVICYQGGEVTNTGDSIIPPCHLKQDSFVTSAVGMIFQMRKPCKDT